MAKQANQYDKIFRENLEAVIPSLVQNILGIHAIDTEELPDDLQHTKERKPDVLKKITDVQGNTFVLHLEFQLTDDPDMVYRMAEYHIMLARKYRLSIRQFVLFLGSERPRMTTNYADERLKYHFPLISFSSLDYRLFLNSSQPEEIILSVLANFGGEPPQTVLYQILRRVEETTTGELALKRHYSQLRVLAQLRNLEKNLRDLTMDSIAKYVSLEKDVAYLVGLDKGEEKGEEKIVANLLRKLNYTPEQIADMAGVSIEFVRKIKEKLSADNT